MKCPFCRTDVTEVYNTRTTRFKTQIWRRRRCKHCSQSFTTYEAPNLGFLRISSTSTAKPTPYSRARLFQSVYDAFLGTRGNEATIDAVTDTIEAKILDLKSSTVTATAITDIVLTTLKHFDTGAYLRYLATHTHLASNAELKKALKKH